MNKAEVQWESVITNPKEVRESQAQQGTKMSDFEHPQTTFRRRSIVVLNQSSTSKEFFLELPPGPMRYQAGMVPSSSVESPRVTQVVCLVTNVSLVNAVRLATR